MPKYHPKFSDMFECIKKEDLKTRSLFLAPSTKPRQAKKDLEKDFQIQLLQEDFDQNCTEFAVYFENLTY